MERRIVSVVLLIVFFTAGTSLFPNVYAGTKVSVEDLVGNDLVTDAKLSPDGKYIALRVFFEGAHQLRFVKRDTGEEVAGFATPPDTEVGDYFWANDERVVGGVLVIRPGEEQPISYGELFGTNFDGSNKEWLYGWRSGESSIGSRIQKKDADYAWGSIIDVLPDDHRNILISSTAMSRSSGRKPEAVKLDVYNGRESSRLAISKYGRGEFYTDDAGELRLITSYDAENNLHIQSRPKGSETWRELDRAGLGRTFAPIAMSEDVTHVYALDYAGDDKLGLHKLALDGSEYEKIYAHDRVNLTDAVRSTDGRSVYAFRVDDGYPSYLIFKQSHAEAQTFRQLLETFAGNLVSIRSRSKDGRYWIVKTETDTNPGQFFLFDNEKVVLTPLLESKPALHDARLSPMEPISYESFDGTEIAGYFTPALEPRTTPAPLVVLVHGGPIARDYWGFNPEVQVLATNGYSVLQVNFRGSSGYGAHFVGAGKRRWGSDIQQDIIAGTKWAIESGRARKGAVCIMGGSFGAYSTVMSMSLAPELYACGIANAGVYDLELMYEDGDIEDFYWGEAYLEENIGKDKEELARFSPVNRVQSIRAPLLVAHGKKDERAPFSHAEALKKALDEHDKSYEWFIRSREGHGFYSVQNRVEFLNTALEFLDKHIGATGPASNVES